MKTQFVTEQQRAYMQRCAELTAELVQLLPDLEAGTATEEQKTKAIEAAQLLQGTGDNVAFLARGILGKLDPVTPGNMYQKMLGAEGPQPPAFMSDRPQPLPATANGIPASRW